MKRRKPRLSDYPIGAIFALVEQRNDEEFDKEAELVVMDKLVESSIPLGKLMKEFVTSEGFKRRMLANLLAIKLMPISLVSKELVKKVVEVVDVQYLWMLSENAFLGVIRKIAKEELDKRLTLLEKDEQLAAGLEAKMALDDGDIKTYEMKLQLERGLDNDKY